MPNERVSPGLTYKLDLRGFLGKEQEITHMFAKFFRINFAREQNFKQQDYAFVFVRPTQEYLQRFLLEDRELLILFSRARKFDGRLFDFVDFVNSQYGNRVDRLCMVLVADDNELAGRVDSYIRRQSEARLVIPVSYEEVDDNLEGLLQSRLNKFFFGRDLFAFSSPLKSDTYFFGRTGVLQFLYEKYRSGENAGLFGLRKVGKTSVLHAVQRWLDTREEPLLIIDCQDSAIQLRSWNELLYYIIDRLINELEVGGLKSLLKLERYEPKNASSAFENDLREISHWFGGKRILLLFDEIENIAFDLAAEEHWRSGRDFLLFWQTIRAIYQRNTDLFSFVITGVNPKVIETDRVSGTDNPLFRIVSPTYLEFFAYPDVEKMVSETGKYMGLAFEPEVISLLMTDFGGHPFLVRQACSNLHGRIKENRPFSVDRFYYSSIRPDVEKELRDYVDQILSVLREHYQVEYELLELLAVGNYAEFNEWVETSPEFITHLKGYGLIRESARSYHLTIRCVHDYLIERNRAKTKLSTKAQRQQEVSETRNRLEGQLRKTVRLVLVTNLGANAAKQEVIQRLLKPGQKTRMEKLSINEMFASAEKELYFTDLQRIVIANWTMFHNVFGSEKTKFDEFMTQINRNRIDAHDKDISDADLALFRIGSAWLGQKCDQFMGES